MITLILILLKTVWSAGEMGYILMKSDDYPTSSTHIKDLATTGKILFDISFDEPILRTILFGSRENMPYERNCHSFVGEVACRRWIITACYEHIRGVFLIGYATIAP